MATPAWAQQRALAGGGVDVSPLRVVLSLVVCLIIAVLAILLIRQRTGALDLRAFFARAEQRSARIRIIETRRLNLHADACLLDCDGKEYLVILQQSGAQVLHQRSVDSVNSR